MRAYDVRVSAHPAKAAEPAAVDVRDYEGAGELLRALTAPTRLALIELLSPGPRCVHELVDTLGVAQPLVSQHLKVLRAAGLVTAARRGREVTYELADTHVAHIVRDAVRHAAERRGPVEPR
jgi:DNA-binding transcriptional ArsR family regulator